MRTLALAMLGMLAACSVSFEKPEPASDDDPSTSSGLQDSAGIDCAAPSIIQGLESDGRDTVSSTDMTDEHLLSARFGALHQLTNKCYLGTLMGDAVEPVMDVQYWSVVLGGAAIKIEHALADGSYGGISYVYPQTDSDAFTYVYVTSAGFHTSGTIVLNDDQSFTASETVEGHPTIKEVRSVSRFDANGLVSMTSEMLDGDEWKPGSGFTFEVTTGAFPRLNPPVVTGAP
ncbi:MAG: hypothetical protein AAF437_14310 [Pseudomonadota bacterium]